MAIETVKSSYETVKWEVAEGESYNLRLRTQDICEVEKMIGGKNLLTLVTTIGNGMPPLDTMITVTQCAMRKFHHGFTKEKVCALFDKYIENGGSQIDFLMNVYLNIFVVSGFFTKEQATAMKNSLAEVTESTTTDAVGSTTN